MRDVADAFGRVAEVKSCNISFCMKRISGLFVYDIIKWKANLTFLGRCAIVRIWKVNFTF